MFADSCCAAIKVESSGEARQDQPLYIGVYRRHPESYNARPVYVKETLGREETLFAYYFISEKHGVSLWVIGPHLGEFRAGIRNSEASPVCLHHLREGWKFASRSGVWADTDPSLTVRCHQAGEEEIFESRKLPLQPRNLSDRTEAAGEASCSWSAWGGWSQCSRSCGGGRQVRVRQGGGRDCRATDRERRVCHQASCPVRNIRGRNTRRTTTTTTTTTSTTTIRTTTTTTRRTTTTTTRRTTTTTTRRTTRPTTELSRGRVECFTCGSLFSTEGPDCPQFDSSDPAQRKTCQLGEACLYYSWQKAENDFGNN